MFTDLYIFLLTLLCIFMSVDKFDQIYWFLRSEIVVSTFKRLVLHIWLSIKIFFIRFPWNQFLLLITFLIFRCLMNCSQVWKKCVWQSIANYKFIFIIIYFFLPVISSVWNFFVWLDFYLVYVHYFCLFSICRSIYQRTTMYLYKIQNV